MSLCPLELKGDCVSTSYAPLYTAISTFRCAQIVQSVLIPTFASPQIFVASSCALVPVYPFYISTQRTLFKTNCESKGLSIG
jgi:hypothetical protein